jgi:hypothetical protein
MECLQVFTIYNIITLLFFVIGFLACGNTSKDSVSIKGIYLGQTIPDFWRVITKEWGELPNVGKLRSPEETLKKLNEVGEHRIIRDIENTTNTITVFVNENKIKNIVFKDGTIRRLHGLSWLTHNPELMSVLKQTYKIDFAETFLDHVAKASEPHFYYADTEKHWEAIIDHAGYLTISYLQDESSGI